MNIKITGKDLKATEAIKDYVEKKLGRLEKYFDTDFDVLVTITTIREEQIAEMAVKVKGDAYRTEVSSSDLYASIDKNIDILEGQIRKNKTKRDKMNKDESIRLKPEEVEKPFEIENEIIKAMKNQGFNHIVDLKQVNSSVKMRLKNAENDLALIRSIQNQFHFDNLIVAQIVNDNSASTLSVKMISMNTGEIIFADSFISNQNRMFTKNNPSRTIKNLSRQAAFAVSNAALNQAALIEQHITILVTKNTLDKFGQNIQNLNKRIKTIRNVNDIFTRNVNNGVAELDINFDGTTYELMTELKRIGFNIIEMNSNYIKI